MTKKLSPAREIRVEQLHGNSRFLGILAPAESMEEARAFLAAVRAEFPDASHHVYAIRVGHGQSVTEGVSDDGEPSGTSGPPVLAVLRGSGLGDAIVVVVRWFGGTKLGTGGLVTAYGETAKAVLARTEIVEKIDRVRLLLRLPYALYDRVKLLAAEHDALLEEESFAERVTLIAAPAKSDEQGFCTAIADLSAGAVQPERLEGAEES